MICFLNNFHVAAIKFIIFYSYIHQDGEVLDNALLDNKATNHLQTTLEMAVSESKFLTPVQAAHTF